MLVYDIPAGATSLVANAIKRELAAIAAGQVPEWFFDRHEPPARLTICNAAVSASELFEASKVAER